MIISVANCNCHFLIVASNCSHIEEMNVIFFSGCITMTIVPFLPSYLCIMWNRLGSIITRLYTYIDGCLPSCLRENLEQIAN